MMNSFLLSHAILSGGLTLHSEGLIHGSLIPQDRRLQKTSRMSKAEPLGDARPSQGGLEGRGGEQLLIRSYWWVSECIHHRSAEMDTPESSWVTGAGIGSRPMDCHLLSP